MNGNGQASPLNVAILSEGVGFPWGMAGTRRIRLLAAGLNEFGCAVRVLIIRPFEDPTQPINVEPCGESQGIVFEYLSGTTLRSRSFLLRRWYDLRGILTGFLRLWQLRSAGRLDAVILYTFDPGIVSRFAGFCSKLGVASVLELCEWPLDQCAVHGGHARRASRFCSRAPGQVDAILPISASIEQRIVEYSNRLGREIPQLRIPVLLDPREFALPDKKHRVDGLPILISSGSLAYDNIVRIILDLGKELDRRRIPFTLKFTGCRSERERAWLGDEVQMRGIGRHVELLGYLDDAALKNLYSQASVLLAPLPEDPQSISRFPTKIAEYLASGPPVLTTAIGEVGHYLKDGVTAFVAPVCSPSALADKVEEILGNPERAAEIARAGRRLAETEFDYVTHGRRLGFFLVDLKRRTQNHSSRFSYNR